MCPERKQFLNICLSATIVLTLLSSLGNADAGQLSEIEGNASSLGQLVIGEGAGGITDRAYVIAPPNWYYVVDIEPGSFLNCGERVEARMTDGDGRDEALITCGVTLTETVVIPAASTSATITIHY